ncbi:MAG: hypothetical protein KKD39_07055 [Candidatus Altiarchaeota archaeon]|nr:hypothetical protein [Candidatus Altiarchaeota archaeon]
MSEETNALFKALSALEDIRELLRQSAPKHKLDPEQKKALVEAIEKVNSSVGVLEGLK